MGKGHEAGVKVVVQSADIALEQVCGFSAMSKLILSSMINNTSRISFCSQQAFITIPQCQSSPSSPHSR